MELGGQGLGYVVIHGNKAQIEPLGQREVEAVVQGAPVVNEATGIRWWIAEHTHEGQPATEAGASARGLRVLVVAC
jgi:hypothetical protein